MVTAVEVGWQEGAGSSQKIAGLPQPRVAPRTIPLKQPDLNLSKQAWQIVSETTGCFCELLYHQVPQYTRKKFKSAYR